MEPNSTYKDELSKEGDSVTFSRLGTTIQFEYEYGHVSVYVSNKHDMIDLDPGIAIAADTHFLGGVVVEGLWNSCLALADDGWLVKTKP